MALPAEFLAQIVVDGTCWKWTGPVKKTGAPIYESTGCAHPHPSPVPFLAQAFAYQELIGPIPKQQHFLHYLCRTMGCVNPDHVRPV